MSRPARAVCLVTALLACAAVSVAALGQGAPRSTKDGVYARDQATRGGKQYAQVCASCHDPARIPEGKKAGPPLVGDKFLDKWRDRTLGELLTTIETTMPNDGSAVLTSEETADVVAYVLQANGFPAGSKALSGKDKDVVIK